MTNAVFHPTHRSRAALVVGLLAVISPGVASAQGPDVDTPNAPVVSDLPDLPFATMGMKLERTFLKVDVLALTLRLDGSTADRLAETLAGHASYDDDLETLVAELALAPAAAVAEIEFLRGASLDQFLDGVDDDMRKALEAGWLDEDAYRAIKDSLPVWFEFLDARRIQDGDRLSYEVRGDTLRTVFFGAPERDVLLDHTDIGRQNVLALLGAYFAPRSSFRQKLIRSLWTGWDPADP